MLTGLRPGALKPGRLYRAALEGATYPLLFGKPCLPPPLLPPPPALACVADAKGMISRQPTAIKGRQHVGVSHQVRMRIEKGGGVGGGQLICKAKMLVPTHF